ncbi:MAG: hypothetical protein NC410_09170 [Oscillibacter sp.]|nr:hypothetical protein [Oscillibacter sp.]
MKQIVYITKHALTCGIIEKEADASCSDRNYISTKEDIGFTCYKIGKDVFFTLEEAKVRAEKIRLKKIDSLKKQIKKLEKMTF